MRDLHVVQLYLNEMNTYGDRGNLVALTARARAHGYEPVVHHHHPGDDLPERVDVVLGGGGEDTGQQVVSADLQRVGGRVHELVAAGVPMLLVCGTYQLFGRGYTDAHGVHLPGIGVFAAETVAAPARLTGPPDRLVGNVAVDTSYGTLYGFENHGGITTLDTGQEPLGRVTRGRGNNGLDATEGARTGNAVGTYLHGPLLPANPALTDALIAAAVANTHGETLADLPADDLVATVRAAAAHRRY